jgi:PLD-like domain
LAEKIKASAKKYAAWGRTPEQHGSLHLFVITNSTDSGMGVGTVNTYRMLNALGRADRLPEVARDQRLEDVNKQLDETDKALIPLRNQRAALDSQARYLQGTPTPDLNQRYAAINDRLGPLEARKRTLEEAKARLEPRTLKERIFGDDRTPEAIKQEAIPGLKVHIATLVAPDTPAGLDWQEVYIHAKLMLIDDAFMTMGSANINTRSMQTDSELNIAHHRPEITKPLRDQQWAKYTGGRVMAGTGLKESFKEWGKVMSDNSVAKNMKGGRPVAQLAEFLRTSDKISNKD